MEVSQKDITRLQKQDHIPKAFCFRSSKGIYYLKNRAGYCYFFDPVKKECKEYANRPDGCRYYPILYDVHSETLLIDDTICPMAHTVTTKELEDKAPIIKKTVKEILNL